MVEAQQEDRYVATFVAFDPPRGSWFAIWNPDEPGGLLNESVPGWLESLKSVDIELVVPGASRGTERIQVAARKLPMVDAIGILANLGGGGNDSMVAWSRVVRFGLGLIARGLVLPWVSPDGWDTWRVDPLDAGGVEEVVSLADAMPAYGHCTPIGPRRGQISDPVFAIRACLDAIADRLVRSPAASVGRSSAVFADLNPTRVRHLRPWVGDLAGALCAESGLCIKVHPPGEFVGDDAPAPDHWRLSFEVQSTSDPSLLVAAHEVWSGEPGVVARLGDHPDLVLLTTLGRLAEVSELFEAPSGNDQPCFRDLAPEELDQFLDDLDRIEREGIATRWPADLVAPRIERQLVASSGAPAALTGSSGVLEGLLSVDWEFLLEGVALTLEDLETISEAKRGIVKLGGRWVRLDPRALGILASPTPEVTLGEIMAATLGQDIQDPLTGESISILLDVSLGTLAGKLGELEGERSAPEPDGLATELRPYQRRGLAWLSDLASLGLGGILADDMGLGKTVQLLALHLARGGPTLVVCPTSVLANWEAEARRFCPGSRVIVFHGPTRSLEAIRPGDVVLTTYGVVRSDSETLAHLDWDLVVADEAQNIKNPRSRSARAMRAVPSKVRIAMTGTPIENRLSELWSIMDWAVPGLLGTLPQFTRNVAVPIERRNDPAATRRLARVVAPFMLRRTKSDPGIAPELPTKTELDVVVPLTPEQATLYRATTTEVLEGLRNADGIKRQGLVLRLLTALKQITNHPAHYLDEDGPLPGRSGKLDALETLLAESRDRNESSIIFTQYVAMGRLLVSHLTSLGIRTNLLHGGLSIKKRQSMIDAFQSGDLEVLVLSLKAAGTGLNLTKATQVIHYDRWWNPAVEDQATDRAYRIGQRSPVVVRRLITEGTVEDRVGVLLAEKRELAEKVIGGGESWISSLSDTELESLVCLQQPLPIHTERVHLELVV